MSSLSSQTILKPFEGVGFGNWEFRIKLLLEHHDVLNVISEEPPTDESQLTTWKKKDLKARNLIIQFLGDNVLEMVKAKVNAKEIMETLSKTYKKSGLSSQVQLQTKLRNMRHVAKDSLNDFIVNFEKTVTDLRNCGGTISETEITTQLLSAMPQTYQNVTTAIDILFSHDVSKVNLDFVKSRLLQEEERQKKESNGVKEYRGESSQVFVTQGRKYKEKPQSKFPYKCYNCGMKGHKKLECPKLKESPRDNQRKKAYSTVHDDEIAFISCQEFDKGCNMVDLINPFQITFVVDSGCTNHLVTSEFERFLTERKQVNHTIKVAKKGESVVAYLEGTLHLQTESGVKVRLENVLVCKHLSHNLLSVKKIEVRGLKIIFEDGKICIKDKNDIDLAKGKLKGNLYVLTLNFQTKFEANLTEAEGDLWHRRMGHSSRYPHSRICETCIQGKQTRKPFKALLPELKAKRLLEVVSSDVCGPIKPVSPDGKKYFITFIDNFSHFAVVYFMANKSEAIEKFKEYLAMVKNKFKIVPERIRCDNGGEYISHEFKNLCKQNGIKLEYTIPRTPEQNGISERYNRTLLDKARCLIIDAKMDKEFWKEAVATAAYLGNRTATSTLPNNSLTPAEVWYGFKPNLSKIKVFGCTSYVHIPVEDRQGKLDPRSQKMYLVGYTDNGYRLWNPVQRQIISARNVIFDEFSNRDSTRGECKYQEVEYEQEEGENKEEKEDKNTDEEVQIREWETREDPEHESDEENVEPKCNNQRKSTRKSIPPKKYEDYEMNSDDESLMVALSVGSFIDNVPETYEEAMSIGNGWKEAIQSELNALIKNKTWDIVPYPKNETVIDSRWIFKEKEIEGKLVKKARLVARGYKQCNSNYDLYSPVARMLTIRILFSLCIQEDLFVTQLDVKCAFLNGELKDVVYMEVPKGVENKENRICRLRKALYGLRQAPKCWYEKLHVSLTSMGFKRSQSDPCFYFTEYLFLVVHVDDLIIFSRSIEKLNDCKGILLSKFEMRDLTDNISQTNFNLKFLGLNIIRRKTFLFIHQKELIEKILKKFNMLECKELSIPIQPKIILQSSSDNISGKYPYRELIGFLMYVMLGSRPDLSFSISYFSQFQNNFQKEHWVFLKQILRYLKSTKNFGLRYTKSIDKVCVISAFADADFANNIIDRKSVSGFLISVYDNFVFWKTKKQTTVSLSSAEAEYVALANCSAECIFVSYLISEILSVNVYPIKIYEDNQSSIKMAETLETKRTKHIDVKHHFIRDYIDKNFICLMYIPTAEQVADMLTKALPTVKFKYFRDKISVVDSCRIEGGC